MGIRGDGADKAYDVAEFVADLRELKFGECEFVILTKRRPAPTEIAALVSFMAKHWPRIYLRLGFL
jgi:hypothetical protein